MHDLLGCMADDVADHVDEAVEIATKLIEKEKRIKAAAEEKARLEREAELERLREEGIEPETEEADEPAPELDENGEPVVPPPEPPVESLQTPQFMEALTDLVYHAAVHRLDQFEDVAAARGWEAAYELDRRAAVAAEEKMAWTRFEILRQRFQLLQGEIAVDEHVVHAPGQGLDLWRNLQHRRMETLKVREARLAESKEAAGEPLEAGTPEDVLSQARVKMEMANSVLQDLSEPVLEEVRLYPRAPRATMRILQSVLMTVGMRRREVQHWPKVKTLLSEELLSMMRQYDPEGKRKVGAWRSLKATLTVLRDEDVAQETLASFVLFQWLRAVFRLSEAAVSARKAAAEAAGEEPPHEYENEDEDSEKPHTPPVSATVPAVSPGLPPLSPASVQAISPPAEAQGSSSHPSTPPVEA